MNNSRKPLDLQINEACLTELSLFIVVQSSVTVQRFFSETQGWTTRQVRNVVPYTGQISRVHSTSPSGSLHAVVGATCAVYGLRQFSSLHFYS